MSYCGYKLDLYDKKIIGWAIDSIMTQELVIKALENAVRKRNPADTLKKLLILIIA